MLQLPQRSSGTTRKAEAAAMESTLRELPLMGYADLVERYIEDPALTPAELHAAKLLPGGLDEVRRRAADPVLATVVSEAKAGERDVRTLQGFAQLEKILEQKKDARLSLLATPNAVRDMLIAHEADGRRRNTVRRGLYRALIAVMDRGLGHAKRIEVLSEVRYGPEDDERRIPITRTDVDRLVREVIDPVMSDLVRVALGTGIDQAPILRIRPKHLDPEGLLLVLDGKNAHRFRKIWVPEPVQGAIRRAAAHSRAGQEDRVFPFTRFQVRGHFDAAVERAGLTFEKYGKLRFKDCRAIFATAYLASGGNLKNMMHIMGLTRRETAVRYAKMVPDDHQDEMIATASWLGVDRYLEVVG